MVPKSPFPMLLLRNTALILALALAALGAGAPQHSAPATDNGYAHPTEQGYDFHFGPNPFLPSQAKLDSKEFLKPTDFASAEWCGHCHADIYDQWRQSAHSNSFREPFYVKNVNLLIQSRGIEFTRHCEGCHNPIALFSGALSKNSKVDRSFDQDGITCTVCHSIGKLQNTSGTGSYVMEKPAVMLNPDGTPRYGKVTYDDIFNAPELHKKAMMKDFYRSAEFCAACHKAALPRDLNTYKWLRAFSVYDEWQQSSWSRETPLPFYKKTSTSTCQTCHMPLSDAKFDNAAKNGKVVSHRWAAANTAIPQYFGYKEQMAEVEKSLKDNLISIDFFALEKEAASEAIAPIAQRSFEIAPGELVTVDLVLQNKGIGHSLVPEQRDFYESWVQFTATDERGNIVFDSGSLDPNGYLDESAHSYTNRLIGDNGQLLDKHQVWASKIRAFDNTILPGRSDIVRFQFRIPQSGSKTLNLNAKINYRRFRQGYLDFVLGTGQRYPVVVMAEKSFTLNVGKNEPTEQADVPRDRVRWNNFGIALLDKVQYPKSAAAFEKVIALTPQQPDGYINLGLVDLTDQKYAAARVQMNKALALAPNDPRALFYLGMVDRIEGKLDQAVSHFKSVVQAYPRLRQARQELGYTYYQQRKYDLARAEYEALQTVDPDDLAAHYNLMIIYRRLGMTKQAQEQAMYFADRKDDPTATSLALTFLKNSGAAANESVPWHVHGTKANGAAPGAGR
jgi:tetratricopeptide (TPR) repeat protein